MFPPETHGTKLGRNSALTLPRPRRRRRRRLGRGRLVMED
jgi:hypothetical protein